MSSAVPEQARDARRRSAPLTRIAIFEPYVSPRLLGASSCIAAIFRHLDPDRFAVELITPGHGDGLDHLRKSGGTVRTLAPPRRLVRDGRAMVADAWLGRAAMLGAIAFYAVRLAMELRRRRIDIVECHNLRALLIAGTAARLAGCKLVWYVRSGLENPRLDAIGFGLADRVLFPGAASRDRCYRSLVNRHAAKIGIVERGIDLDSVLAAADHDHEQLRRDLALGSRALNLLWIGPVVAGRGLGEMVDAIARLRKEVPDAAVSLTVVGHRGMTTDPAYAAVLTERAARLDIAPVRLLGERSDVVEICAQMDVVVLPTPDGGTPSVALQAMAVGATVVAGDCGALRDLIDDGVNGLLVPPRDAAALAAVLARLARDAGLRNRLGEAGRATALQRSSCAMVAGLAAAYGGLMRGRRAPAEAGYPAHAGS